MPVKCELPAKIGRCFAKPFGHNFQISGLPLNQRYFIYIKIPLIQGLGWFLKIVVVSAIPTPPYFCWQLAFYRHLPTSGRQNTVKTTPQPLFVNSAFVALYVGIILPVGPSRYLSSLLSWRPKTKNFRFFTNFHGHLQKIFSQGGLVRVGGSIAESELSKPSSQILRAYQFQ